MTTKILDPKKLKLLQPAHGLWPQYQPARAPYRFRARSLPAARAWQSATRRMLAETIGGPNAPRVPLAPKLIERVDRGDYVREKLLLHVARQSVMPVYLLLPKRAARPLPVVLALHGHGYGVKDIVGLWEDGTERHTPDGYHQDFGVALCRQGFAVAAPEISCFGERQTDFSYLNTAMGQEVPSTCAHTAMLAFHLGFSVVGLRVAEGRRLVDYLTTRRELDCRRLGAMGISGGGMHAFFSTCLDLRIRACVVSGYFCTFRDSLLAMAHCPCNFVPGLGRFGEMSDLAGLIAPRPLLIESGSRDPIFPRAAVKRSVARAREIYRVFGRAGRLQTDFFEGRHRIHGTQAYPFLREQLR